MVATINSKYSSGLHLLSAAKLNSKSLGNAAEANTQVSRAVTESRQQRPHLFEEGFFIADGGAAILVNHLVGERLVSLLPDEVLLCCTSM